jgi:hypothetical protein
MATLDQLFQAMGMFKQASQEYGIARGIEDATNAVKKITADMAPDPMKQLEAQDLVSKQLQARLTSLGAPQAQIAAAVGAVAPQIPKTPEEIRQRALAATSKEEQMFWEQKADIAQQVMGQGRLAEEMPKLEKMQEFDLAKIDHQGEWNKKLKALEDKTKTAKLPEDTEGFIKGLTAKVAHQTSISSTIKSFEEAWPELRGEQRLYQARQLIKTLNSVEGQDAVGVEEVKRLSSQLEFALGNFTNSNPTQFGRDMRGFFDMVKGRRSIIEKALNQNINLIETARTTGRIPKPVDDVGTETKGLVGNSGNRPSPKPLPAPAAASAPEVGSAVPNLPGYVYARHPSGNTWAYNAKEQKWKKPAGE